MIKADDSSCIRWGLALFQIIGTFGIADLFRISEFGFRIYEETAICLQRDELNGSSSKEDIFSPATYLSPPASF